MASHDVAIAPSRHPPGPASTGAGRPSRRRSPHLFQTQDGVLSDSERENTFFVAQKYEMCFGSVGSLFGSSEDGNVEKKLDEWTSSASAG